MVNYTSNSVFTENILERTTEIGPGIGHLSTSLINLPSAKKVQPFHNLFNNFFDN